ncbi:MAG: UpxY family transcription antiterminator [Prolixibacteraceae bacterium]|nr:UpxY family transcription antiterminator [Prolixibacteraceae bacterium]MBN2649845.1 UpxY family transcription antiterminator [Prolixibacteraceae bacterium]
MNQKRWHAVYVKSRTEKKVKIELDYQGIEVYLPIQKKLRQWSDRKKWVDFPLISGYLFVHISPKEYDRVLQTIGVVSYVRFDGTAAIIRDEDIELIKRLLRDYDKEIEVSFNYFEKGDEVEVIGGPLSGIKGKLIYLKGKNKVAVQIENLKIALTVELSSGEIKKILAPGQKSFLSGR